jgi:hypothetical protein
MVVIVVIAGGKDAIVAAAINHRHSQRHRHLRWYWLNPNTAAINNDRYHRC